MKAEIKSKEKKYPRLMIESLLEVIVLFIEEDKGFLLLPYNNKHKLLPNSITNWDIKNFEDFDGTVELSN